MQTELTFWVHLQVASSAIQLMKKHADRTHFLGAFAGGLISHPAHEKKCRQNSLSGCICRWPHQPSSSWKKMQTELTPWMHLQVASSAIQLMKKHADRTHSLDAFAGGLISHPAHEKTCRQNSHAGCICRWPHQPSSSWKNMQTELTCWVHLQVASSAIQLMNKTCRQNSHTGCICRWPHQPSSSWKNMQTELTYWMHLQVASSAIQLMKKHADRTHFLGAFAVASSAIQLMKKACRQNSQPGCICRWPHQPSSSWKKHADRTHILGAFAGGLISHPAHE